MESFIHVKSKEFEGLKNKLYPRVVNFAKKMGKATFEKNCLYLIKSQYKHPINISLGKIYLVFIMCFESGSEKETADLFEKDFQKKYSEALVYNYLSKFTQKFRQDHLINIQYLEQKMNIDNLSKYSGSNTKEFPNYFASLAPEGIVLNKFKSENHPNGVTFAVRYDQIIRCAGFTPEKFKQYLNQELQSKFGRNNCCVVYVSDWDIYANTHLICSNRKADWECTSEIQIFRASFFEKCITQNLKDLHRNIEINKGFGKIEKSDFLVKARTFFIINDVIKTELKYIPKDKELYQYIKKYKDIAPKLFQKIKDIIIPYCNQTFIDSNNEEDKFDCNKFLILIFLFYFIF
jgi:hypothetical protein